jgi:hypothetical protein
VKQAQETVEKVNAIGRRTVEIAALVGAAVLGALIGTLIGTLIAATRAKVLT